MPTKRGPITSGTNRTPEQIAEAVMSRRSVGRAKPIATHRDPTNPLKGVTKFIAHRGTHRRLRIGPLPADFEPEVDGYVLDHAADDARTVACVQAAKGQYLVFTRHYEPNAAGVMEPTDNGAFPTDSRAIIDWLRHRIRMGVFNNLSEDVSMIDIPCPEGCGFSVKNSQSGRAALSTHMLDVHYAKGATPGEERTYAIPPELIADRPLLRDETEAAAAKDRQLQARRANAAKATAAKKKKREEVNDQNQAAA